MTYNDPENPVLGVEDCLNKMNVPSTYPSPGILEMGITTLQRGEWEKMCQAQGLSGIELHFEMGGTLNNDRLRWQIKRKADGQGMTGHVDLLKGTDREHWELLVTHLQDALETLAYMPLQSGYHPNKKGRDHVEK